MTSNKASILKNIVDFFSGKHPAKEVKKMKRFAMHNQIKLKEQRKLFCRKCHSMNLRVKSIKKGIKTTECKDCKSLARWKMR